MPAALEAESTLTDRYQTTVPQSVRRALRLRQRDKIRYSIRPGGEVVLQRAGDAAGDDPALGAFLDFLARDIARRPRALKALDKAWVERLRALTGRAKIDLDAPLAPQDE
ncbi:MAG: type II toxin-antitoxin system PrlF family antitoxin [Betaproteobacteria bacterium]